MHAAIGPWVLPIKFKNHLTLLAAMLSLAITLEWLAKCPRILKPKNAQTDFAFLGSDGEYQRLPAAARGEGLDVAEFHAVALYTGMRAGDLCGLQWDDVNFDRRPITVRRSYDRPTKTAPMIPIDQHGGDQHIARSWRAAQNRAKRKKDAR